jgi:hypothetical protein
MFARWLFVRLNAAERALREGRLDEACTAALQPDVRQHPRGQKLLDSLVKPLLARARLHRQAGRLREALADLDILTALGRTDPDAQVLRQHVTDELGRKHAQLADERHAIDRVAENLRAGQLETGRLNLERVDDLRRRQEFMEELDVRVQRAGQLLEQATQALERNDLLAAIRCWEDATQRHGRTDATDAFAARLANACATACDQWIRAGKVDQVLAARAGVAALLPAHAALSACDRVVALCTRAVAQFAAADYAGLRQSLLRLKAGSGEAPWLNAALDALGRIADAQDELMASPLGLLVSVTGAAARAPVIDQAAPPAPPPAGSDVAMPFLLLIDGGGSALLLRQDRVRLGREGSSACPEIGLTGDLQAVHAEIERRGDDYFLTAHGPTEINRRRIEHALLRDGDRIVMDSAKLVFARPSAKSASAVLRLSHRCRLPQDVSDIVLFRDTCLIGPAPTCHLRTREGHGQIVLFDRGGVLQARLAAGPSWPATQARAMELGQPLEFGDLRLTMRAYEA